MFNLPWEILFQIISYLDIETLFSIQEVNLARWEESQKYLHKWVDDPDCELFSFMKKKCRHLCSGLLFFEYILAPLGTITNLMYFLSMDLCCHDRPNLKILKVHLKTL